MTLDDLARLANTDIDPSATEFKRSNGKVISANSELRPVDQALSASFGLSNIA